MNKAQTTIVFMVGDDACGGLCDRMRAIVWLYNVCKKHRFNFKIHFTKPFNLTDYLNPNLHDWTISKKEVDAMQDAIECYCFTSLQSNKFYGSIPVFYETLENFLLKSAKDDTNVLVHSNIMANDVFDIYGKLFNELFCFSGQFRKKLQNNISQINNKYVAAHFRFQFLLNDSNSELSRYKTDTSILNSKEQEKLILFCLKKIEEIHNLNPNHKILICSDSAKFIDFVKKLDYVCFFDGERGHFETKNASSEMIDLTFLDYFSLVYAEKLYSIIGKDMYASSFPKYASLHYKIPFYCFTPPPSFFRKIMGILKKAYRLLRLK